MKAVKANKVYTITEAEKKRYIDEGFDICDDDGEIIAYGRGKTVPYEEYCAVQAELEKLQAELEEAKCNTANDEEVVKILHAYAVEHEIDLGRATTVTGIVKKIQEAAANDQ